jgi:glycosyltransferase involved in cell wall biosynthesis
MPQISIVTVVFNDRQHLEQTILSVLGQTYQNIEYIIIDGGSIDGTVDIIRRYEDRVAYWQSEPDRGIYDAMNKGISAASGDWINFMNSGDTFCRSDVLSTIFPGKVVQADLIYGHHQVNYHERFSMVKKALDLKFLWKGMVFRHQSLFVRTALMKQHPFDLSYRIGADYEFIFFAYMNNYSFHNCDQVIAAVSTGGVSEKNLLLGNQELWSIVTKYRNTLPVNAFYAKQYVVTLLKIAVKKVLPRKATDFILSLLNKP